MEILDRALAAVYDPFMASVERAGLGQLRAELLGGLSGHVVELGAGTGANLPHYPDTVTRISLCEPTPAMVAKLREKVDEADVDRVEVLDAPAEHLPFDDASVDHVVATLVLCTVDDLDRSIAEARRVLRPDGTLVVIEHVAADGGLARTVQHAATPVWKVVARGCHLDRDTGDALAAGGFDTSGLVPARIPGVDRIGRGIAGALRPTG